MDVSASKPGPIVMNRQVAEAQPHIGRLTRLGVAAAERGKGLALLTRNTGGSPNGRLPSFVKEHSATKSPRRSIARFDPGFSVRQSCPRLKINAKRTGSSYMTETSANKDTAGSPTSVPLPRAEPEAVGMSSTRLGRIVTALNKEIEAGQFLGAVVAVARRKHLVFHEAVGHLGPDRSTPMPRDAVFAIASMTKPVTGVAALLLWEEGRLGLADPIERFLPQLGNRCVAVLNERALAGQGPIETVPPSDRSQYRI